MMMIIMYFVFCIFAVSRFTAQWHSYTEKIADEILHDHDYNKFSSEIECSLINENAHMLN